MDKKVVFAVAGSGKTSSIIDALTMESRCLIVTFTDNNTDNLKKRVIKKFHRIPRGIRVYSYFTFLYSFCIRPLCAKDINVKGINFNFPLPRNAERAPKNTMEHYVDKNGRLFYNRISKLLIETNVVNEVNERLENFFDHVFIDEVQDFAANDFNLLCRLVFAKLSITMVGDFYQHTFDTSRDGATRKNLHSCFEKYCFELTKVGYLVDLTSLSNSFRCSPIICTFVSDNLGIKIQSHRKDPVKVEVVTDADSVASIYGDESIVKLFYQDSGKYKGNTDNWGNTKGLDDFQDVCVVLNAATYKAFVSSNLLTLAPTTRNKLYVACTRAKGNLYFIPEVLLKEYKV